MKHSEQSSQQLWHYLLLVILLSGTSGLAVFFVITDKDIQVVTQEHREFASDEHIDELTRNLQKRILSEFSPLICENASLFFNHVPIEFNNSLTAISSHTDASKWSRTEKDAFNRCLTDQSDALTKRACFLVEGDWSGDGDSFLSGKRRLIELQIQVRDQSINKPVSCQSLADKMEEDLVVLSYFSVYWIPSTKNKTPMKIHKRTKGFFVALPGGIFHSQSM
ncbi:MAG: hypothetical protein ACOH5I_08460 [Oligoflexus sp.]